MRNRLVSVGYAKGRGRIDSVSELRILDRGDGKFDISFRGVKRVLSESGWHGKAEVTEHLDTRLPYDSLRKADIDLIAEWAEWADAVTFTQAVGTPPESRKRETLIKAVAASGKLPPVTVQAPTVEYGGGLRSIRCGEVDGNTIIGSPDPDEFHIKEFSSRVPLGRNGCASFGVIDGNANRLV